jgi:hypothetical protein
MFTLSMLVQESSCVECSLRLLPVMPLIETKGTTATGYIEHRQMSSTRDGLVFVLRWYCDPWTSDVVLNFLFLCVVNQKSITPAIDRLIGGG